jgi:hypothetical protein
MQLQIGPHLEESQLEKYSMGILPEQQTASFEEHLLVCETCQDRLLEMDAFVNAVRSVSPKLRDELENEPSRERKEFRAAGWLRELWSILTSAKVPVMLAGAAALVLMLAIPRYAVQTRGAVEPYAITLEARRGIEGLSQARAPEGRPLTLRVDLTELPSFPEYGVEVVGGQGEQILRSSAKPNAGTLSIASGKLPQGIYFVRLFAPDQELLREFTLHVE